jgi:hypothetical protein
MLKGTSCVTDSDVQSEQADLTLVIAPTQPMAMPI